MMEVETRMPGGAPPRPFSEGPSYSPITPERGPTPEGEEDGGRNSLDQDNRGSRLPVDQHAASLPFAGKPPVNKVGDDAGRSGDAANPQRTPAARQQQHRQTHGMDASILPPPGVLAPVSSQDLQALLVDTVNPQSVDPGFLPSGVPLGDTDPSMLPPLVDDAAFMESAASVQDSERNRIRAFAKLEFDDGQFYMNTYAIEIGRDRDAARQAERRMVQEHDRKESEGRRSRDGSNPDLERAHRLQDAAMSAAASVISGGIMHVGDGEERSRRRKKGRSKSTGSSSKAPLLGQPAAHSGTTDYQALANASLLDHKAARPVDLTNMMPSPDECPLIPIHPPPTTEGGLTGYKGISRKHVRIAYNHEKGLFELHVLGRNGCFIDGDHMEKGEVSALASGTEIQIGGVSMRFVLPNVPDGETGTDLRSDAISQSAMSFDFEDGRGESAVGDQDSDSPTTDNEDDRYRELRLAQQAEALLSEEDDDDDDNDDDEDGDGEEEEEQEEAEIDVRKSRPKIMLKLSGFGSKNKPKPVEEEPPPPKRKVGRPPKNGIMSKREEAELRRKEKEATKAKNKERKAAEEMAEERPIKTEIESQQDELPASPIDRKKGKKKKPEESIENPDAVLESIEKDTTDMSIETQVTPAAKPPKKERPAKPPRSPSPVFNEAELTAEQLAKPSQSYVVLIHEALSNHPDGRMSLPQIYRAIERRYPYYKLRVQTVGWQSSVRHNLSQHPAFVKIERDGKGWMWGLDPAISIEREKKRRPSPPPMQAPGWNSPAANSFNNRPFPHNAYNNGPNGQMPQNPYAFPPHPQSIPPARGFPLPPGQAASPSFSGPQQPSGSPAAYQSPYDTSRPPPSAGQPATDGNQAASAANLTVPQIPRPYLAQTNRAPPAGQPGAPSPNGAPNAQLNGSNAMPNGLQNQSNVPLNGTRPSHPPQASPPQASPMPAPPVRPPISGQRASTPSVTPSQSQASPALSPPPENVPAGVPPEIWAAVERFRGLLRPAVSKVPEGEVMLSQAINKSVGLRSREAYRAFPRETHIIAGLKSMLEKFGWPTDDMIAYAEGRTQARPTAQVQIQGQPQASAQQSQPQNQARVQAQGQAQGQGYNQPPGQAQAQNQQHTGSLQQRAAGNSTPVPPLPSQYQVQPQQRQFPAGQQMRPGSGQMHGQTQQAQAGQVARPPQGNPVGNQRNVSIPTSQISQIQGLPSTQGQPATQGLQTPPNAAQPTQPPVEQKPDSNLKRPRPSDGAVVETQVGNEGASANEPPAKKVGSIQREE